MDSRLATLFLCRGEYTDAITYMGGCGMNIRIGITVFLHFLVDFLLIVGASSMSGHRLQVKKAALGAFVGAMYAALCMRTNHIILCSDFIRLLVLSCVGIAAFGTNRTAFRRVVTFILLLLALEGITLGFGNGSYFALAMGAASVCCLCLFVFRGHPEKQQYASVRIIHGKRTADLTALLDTGNTLQDPISGLPVLVADYVAAEKLLGITAEQLAKPIETLSGGNYPGLRLIPYTSVGESCGMMLGLRVDRLFINGKEDQMIVAFAPHQIGQGRPFQALAGVML